MKLSEQNSLMLRQQRRFHLAAEAVALAMSDLPEVQKVALFGAVARPLKMEVPRFRFYRERRIPLLHECADADLAVWLTTMADLKALKTAIAHTLNALNNEPEGGVAHHQLDVHLFDAATESYRGRLCIFGQCPKPGKLQCFVPGCGASPFLQQFDGYRWSPRRFKAEQKIILLERV